ncbi:MAG: hypothetical protein LWW92_08990 [Rhodocyclales bacterium]|nr:hypothetical protein [Rhodocyclales bacterium]
MSAPPAPLAQIQAHALELFRGRRDKAFEQLHLYLAPQPLAQGTRLGLGGRHSQELPRPAILVLADLHPGAPWGHPCELHFYDPKDGQHWGWLSSQHAPHLWFEHPELFVPVHTPLAPDHASQGQARQIPASGSGRHYVILYAEAPEGQANLALLQHTLEGPYGLPSEQIMRPETASADPAWLAQTLTALGPRLQPNDHLLLQILPTAPAGGLQPEQLGRCLDQLPCLASLIVLAEIGAPDTPETWWAAVRQGSTAMDTYIAIGPQDADTDGTGTTTAPYRFTRDWLSALAGQPPEGHPLPERLPFPPSCAEAFRYAQGRTPGAREYAHPPTAHQALGLLGQKTYSFSGAQAWLPPQGSPEILLQGLDGGAWQLWPRIEAATQAECWGSPHLLRSHSLRAPMPLNLEDGSAALFTLDRNLALWRGNLAPDGQPCDWQRLPGLFREIVPVANDPHALFGLNADGYAAVVPLRLGLPHALPLGGPFQQLAAARDAQGHHHLFGLDAEGCLHQRHTTGLPHAPWSDWRTRSQLFSGLSVAYTPKHGVEVLVLYENEVWWSHQHENDLWTDWQRIGARAQRCWALASPDGSLDVLTLGPDESLRHLHRNPEGRWQLWTALGGILRQLSPLRDAQGLLRVFGIGPDWGLWEIRQTRPSVQGDQAGAPPRWSGWKKIA